MFDFIRTRSSPASSASSLSLSPTGWAPARATVSPPTTTITTSPSTQIDYFSFTPFRSTMSRRSSLLSPPALSFSDTPTHHTCAYPSWPVRASLSTDMPIPASPSSYLPASSRISDADLEDLEFDIPVPGAEIGSLGDGMGLGISWSAIGNAAPVEEKVESRRRLPPPPTDMRMAASSSKRRRSSSRGTKRKPHGKLGAIAE